MPKVKEGVNKYQKILACVKRAEAMQISYGSRITMFMDLEYADEMLELDFEKLLAFDNFNFAHDICGIARNINRVTKKIENCFLPRCAR